MKYMLDTNICIYLIRRSSPAVLERLKRHVLGEIVVSVITVAELEYGVAKSQQQDRNGEALALFLAPLAIAEFDASAAQHYGQIRATLERRGSSIGAYDMLIAAHALSLNLTLVTNNTREFARVPNLEFENWAAGES